MAKKKAHAPRRQRPIKRAGVRKPAIARISSSVDKDLLAQAEQFARARRTTVAALVEQALRKVIGVEKVPVLPPGDVPMPTADAGPWSRLLAWMEEQQTALTEIRNQLGDVAASLPNDPPGGATRPETGTRIPPP